MRQLSMKCVGPVTIPHAPAGVVVRTYQPKDREALKDALMPLTLRRFDDKALDHDILRRDGVQPQGVFLAVLKGAVVGTATGFVTAQTNTGTLHMVSVLPEASGLGLGRLLCAHAVAYLQQKGCAWVDLTTDDHRLPAVAVYLALGFLPVAPDMEMRTRWAAVLQGLSRAESPAYESMEDALPTLCIKGADGDAGQ